MVSYDERPVYIIKLTDFDPPMYVYTSKAFLHEINSAKKFYSRSYTRRYIKTHEDLAEMNFEIIKIGGK